MEKVIGRVSVSEKNPSTLDEFYFWLDTKVLVKPFDIIKVQHLHESFTFGLIQEISYITDSTGHLANYISSDFGDVNSYQQTLRLGMTYIKAEVLGNTKNIDMPVYSGANVFFANELEIRKALGLGNYEEEIPAGYIRMSNNTTVPIGFNKDFLLGPEGAHINISGISGLATKTSYAMFLMRAIQQKCDNIAFIIINVKGRDLLQIDEPSDKRDRVIEDWRKCQLDFSPFENVKYFYPFNNMQSRYYSLTNCNREILEKQHNSNSAHNFIYTYEEHKEKLNLLFSNIDDPNLTWDSIMHKFLHNEQYQDISTWKEFLKEIEERSKKGSSKKDEIPVVSWRRFQRLINTAVQPYIDKSIFQTSRSPNREYKQVFLSEEIEKIKSGDVYVVDVENMQHAQHQFLVIGDVFQAVKNYMLGSNNNLQKIVIFFDELNKFAPSNAPKNSPILQDILDIAERGRSLGVTLFSAQQFKSAVFDRIKGNCSTHVFGRTNAIEVEKSDYKFIPNTFKRNMTRLEKGELIAEHPLFRTLLKLKFPKPSYKQN